MRLAKRRVNEPTSIARNGEPCDCETPGDWHRVANDFQRAMFAERARAGSFKRHTEVLAKALDEFFRHSAVGESEAEELQREVEPILRALGYGKKD